MAADILLACPMLTSHTLLLKYCHDPRFDFTAVTVRYLDRGAPGDSSSADGAAITELSDLYFTVASASGTKHIPYHRLRMISYRGETVWEWHDAKIVKGS